MIPVACGVLLGAAGEVLIAQRPEGKLAAGKWEFPGGKIEAGETALQALARELHEELGIQVRAARPLIRFRHEYVDRVVMLDTWLIEAFDGEPHGREGQAFAWCRSDALGALDTLPTVAPIARALLLPSHYVFTPPNADESLLRAGLPKLPPGSLLRLRVPALGDEAYAELAARLLPPMRALGLRLVLDREPHSAVELGADGWHASGRALLPRRSRPVPPSMLFGASVHGEDSLAAAQRLGVDLVVLGPVLPTATHPQAQVLGWERFGQLIADFPRPVYAIGGVGPQQLAAAQAHRAQGVAGIRAYWPLPASPAAAA